MKKVLCAVVVAMMLMPMVAVADYDDEPQIVVLELVEEVPKKVYAPKKEIEPMVEYEWTDDEIDALASVFWAETGKNDSVAYKEKLAITQLVWNRAHYGDPFPSEIEDVCKQRGEFNRGRVSDRNRELARLFLNKVRSQAEGHYQGIDMWSSAIYMTREGGSGVLTFQDDAWVTVYRVERD